MKEKWVLVKDNSYSGIYNEYLQKRLKKKRYTVKRKYYVSNLGRCRYNDEIREFKQKRNQYLRFCGKRIHEWVALMFIPNPDNLPCIDHIDTDIFNNRVDNLRWVDYKGNANNEITTKKRTEWSNSEEERKRRKESALKQWQEKRDIMTEAIRKGIENRDTSYITEEYCEKCRKSSKRMWENMTDDEREKRAKCHYKRVEQYSLDGKYIRTYESLKEAGKDNNIRPNYISQYLNGYTINGQGYIWKYAHNILD